MADQEPTDFSSNEVFRHNSVGVEFEHPAGWSIDFENGQIHVLPLEPEILPMSEESYALGMTLMIAKKSDFAYDPDSSLEQFIDANAGSFDGYNLLSREETELATGQNAIQFSFDFQKGLHLMRSYAVVSIRGDLMFVFDVSGQRDTLEKNADDWQNIIQAFRVGRIT